MEKVYCKDCGKYLYSLEEVGEESYYCEDCCPPQTIRLKIFDVIHNIRNPKPKSEADYKFDFKMPH